MKLSLRYGLVGIAALATLSFVHWARVHQRPQSGVLFHSLGVLPNLLAAVAIPFVLIAVWAEQNAGARYTTVRRWFALTTVLSTAGLLGWEFVQQSSRKLVFDPHDIAATLLGACLALALFYLLTPRGV